MITTVYRSYLLRLWLEPNDPPQWRAMLENPQSGERHGFASLDGLLEFIRQDSERLVSEAGLGDDLFSIFPKDERR